MTQPIDRARRLLVPRVSCCASTGSAPNFSSNTDCFSATTKRVVIVYAWVNDENTKRAYGSDTDAYQIFQRMLKSGNPPDDWLNLLSDAKRAGKRRRMGKA